jgi:hypothetical protein
VTTTVVAVLRFCVVTFLLYGIGYTVPFLQEDLQLSVAIAGLHASAVAAGLIVSGFVGDSVARRIGSAGAARLAAGLLVASAALIAGAAASWLTLTGCVTLGIAAGVIMSMTNQRLAARGGRNAVVLLARANVAALLSALVAPLAIAATHELGLGGRTGLLAPLPLLVVVEWLSWRSHRGEAQAIVQTEGVTQPAQLPQAFWRAWLVLVIGIGIEFSIVFWSSSLVGLRTGVDASRATAAAAAFLVGMIVVRLLLASGFGASARLTSQMGLAFVVAGIGILAVWLTQSLAVGTIALFVAGLGVGPLYPVAIAMCLGVAPDVPLTAAARATLASGSAILVAPFALSVLGQQIGLVNAWPAIAVLAMGGIALLRVRPLRIANAQP